jgi:hypothetical protein
LKVTHLKFRAGLFGWLVFIGLAVMLVMLVQNSKHPQPVPTQPTESSSFLNHFVVPLIPWVLIFGFIWLFVFRQLRQSLWNKNPISQRLFTLDLDDQAVQVSSGAESTRWLWEAFVAFSESSQLLLLRLESNAVLPIPKRALDPAQLEEVRGLATIRAAPRSGGFPIQPINRKI